MIPEISADERSRLVLVSPWIILGFVGFGYTAGIYGDMAGISLMSLIMIFATRFFPKSGVASSNKYKCIFVVSMTICFISLAIAMNAVSSDYGKIMWYGIGFSTIAIIEISGRVMEWASHGRS